MFICSYVYVKQSYTGGVPIGIFTSSSAFGGLAMLTRFARDAGEAYELRAKYQFLKGMDAFQLAIAINENCDQFVTNDKKLEKV